MKTLLLYMGLLVLGYMAAARWSAGKKYLHVFSAVTQNIVYVLVLLMGIQLGTNPQVTANLFAIGMQALIISAACAGGSIVAVGSLRRGLRLRISSDTSASAAAKNSGHSELKSAARILILVAVGTLTGVLIKRTGYAEGIRRFSGQIMTLLLCTMQFCIGIEFGLAGNIAGRFRAMGGRILLFPLAAVSGTLAMGALSGCCLGFSLRESLAISAGFGWYSYAPTVIASAGEKYMVASAVAFLCNVIRETASIVLIPLCVRYIGSLEATAMPGVAAMDIFMPIFERYCPPETVLYAFSTGLAMHIVTSLGVPLIMAV